MGWPSFSICLGSSAGGSTLPHKVPCPVLVPSGVTQWSHGLAPETPRQSWPWPPAWLRASGHSADMSLCHGGQGAWTHKMQVHPRYCCPGVLGQHLGVMATSVREKFPPAPPSVLHPLWKPRGGCCTWCCPLWRGMATPHAGGGWDSRREHCLQPAGRGTVQCPLSGLPITQQKKCRKGARKDNRKQGTWLGRKKHPA